MNLTNFHNNSSAELNITNSGHLNDETMVPFFVSSSIGVVGVTAHLLVVIFTFKSEAAKHQVSFIIASSSIAEGILCLYFGVWLGLCYGLQMPLATREALFTGYIFFGAADNFDVLLALNRYIATAKPGLYQDIFTPKRTWIYIIAVWLSGCATCIPYSIPGCHIMVDYKKYQLTYEKTTCGEVVQFAAEAFGAFAIAATVLNLLTFRQLRKSSQHVVKALGDKEAKRRAKREMAFFIQSCVTSSSTSLIVVFVDFLPLAFSDKWSLYILSSLCPLILLSLDGVSVLFLNGAIRKAIAKHLHCCGLAAKADSDESQTNAPSKATRRSDAGGALLVTPADSRRQSIAVTAATRRSSNVSVRRISIAMAKDVLPANQQVNNAVVEIQ